MSTVEGANSLWRIANCGELLWVTLDGAKMADGGSMNPVAPAAKVEAGEPLDPVPDEDAESPEGIAKLPDTAAAVATVSMLLMASYIGLLKSRLPSVVTAWRS